MKKLVLFLTSLLFCSGCWVNTYQHITYNNNGKIKEKYEINYAKAMVSSRTGSVNLRLADGTELNAIAIDVNASPESATALGGAIGEAAKAFIRP